MPDDIDQAFLIEQEQVETGAGAQIVEVFPALDRHILLELVHDPFGGAADIGG